MTAHEQSEDQSHTCEPLTHKGQRSCTFPFPPPYSSQSSPSLSVNLLPKDRQRNRCLELRPHSKLVERHFARLTSHKINISKASCQFLNVWTSTIPGDLITTLTPSPVKAELHAKRSEPGKRDLRTCQHFIIMTIPHNLMTFEFPT